MAIRFQPYVGPSVRGKEGVFTIWMEAALVWMRLSETLGYKGHSLFSVQRRAQEGTIMLRICVCSSRWHDLDQQEDIFAAKHQDQPLEASILVHTL